MLIHVSCGTCDGVISWKYNTNNIKWHITPSYLGFFLANNELKSVVLGLQLRHQSKILCMRTDRVLVLHWRNTIDWGETHWKKNTHTRTQPRKQPDNTSKPLYMISFKTKSRCSIPKNVNPFNFDVPIVPFLLCCTTSVCFRLLCC